MIATHIVVDFKFNPTLKSSNHRKLKQEIISIGVVKLDAKYQVVDYFFV